MINIHLSKHAIFDINHLSSNDNEIHIFTQFFIHSSSQRNHEIKYCLYQNYLNPFIKKIHLLNEGIYSNTELCDNTLKDQPNWKEKRQQFK